MKEEVRLLRSGREEEGEREGRGRFLTPSAKRGERNPRGRGKKEGWRGCLKRGPLSQSSRSGGGSRSREACTPIAAEQPAALDVSLSISPSARQQSSSSTRDSPERRQMISCVESSGKVSPFLGLSFFAWGFFFLFAVMVVIFSLPLLSLFLPPSSRLLESKITTAQLPPCSSPPTSPPFLLSSWSRKIGPALSYEISYTGQSLFPLPKRQGFCKLPLLLLLLLPRPEPPFHCVHAEKKREPKEEPAAWQEIKAQ